MVGKYKVITLCGSTKFKDEFLREQKRLTLEGNIVISVGLFGHSGDDEVWSNNVKEMLDDMHKRKIDMADEIFVINKNGYIGSSTQSEIEYAKQTNKIINYMEELDLKTDNKKVTIYTDGACSGNPGIGGWGAIAFYKGVKKEYSGFSPETTNNQMELTAAIEVLNKLKEPCEITLYSDSAYLINAFNQGWITNWQMNGFKNANKKPVQNIELWQELIRLNNIHKITWVKVKGHADNEFNNRCDFLATNEISKHQNN